MNKKTNEIKIDVVEPKVRHTKELIYKKGITLISLVITIVILLILATVAIGIAVDSNGLFARARKAGEDWNQSVSDEQTETENLIEKLNKVSVGGTTGGGETQTLAEPNTPTVPTTVEEGIKIQYVTWEEKETGTFEEKLSDEEPEDWYDYEHKKWANIKTTSKDGANEAYWVWIPRYAYQVQAKPIYSNHKNDPEFKIAFLEGTSNTPANASDIEAGKTIKTATELGDYREEVIGEWIVHPAFDFGGTPLAGIWVAKFEASSNTPEVQYGGGNTTSLKVNVKPSVRSWRNITVDNCFTVCQAMDDVGGVLEGATSYDPHLMKNVEWGAVAYLTQSKYGKNSKVWINPNEDCITGQAGTSADAELSEETSPYNEGTGPEASTTGNVYGIYDMSGCAYEYMSAYLDNNYAKTCTNIAKLRLSQNAKYVDVYKQGEEDDEIPNYEANKDKYGDAIYETSFYWSSYGSMRFDSWQEDMAEFPYTGEHYEPDNVVFSRGSGANMISFTGVFAYTSSISKGDNTTSFRPVCIGV